jgi:K+-transporting ATPase KdpF subunit
MWRSVWGDCSFSSSTPAPSTVCEGAMFDPILGLIVSLALGAYLVATLLKPERF